MSFEINKSDIKLNFVLNNSHYLQKISSNSLINLGSSIFISDNGFFVMFSFLKTMFALGHQESDLNRHSMLWGVRKMPC